MRTAAACVLALGLFVRTCPADSHEAPRAPAPASAAKPVLVLFDHGGPYGWLGELYAIAAGNLASHFGPWRAAPVTSYHAGDLLAHRAVIYVGSTYDEPLPPAFLADVASGARPVLWIHDNVWQLARRADFVAQYGFRPGRFGAADAATVLYKGARLTRRPTNDAGMMTYDVVDARRATVLATALRPDGAAVPWAIRARNLTYVGENPFAFTSEEDRYLALCDLMFDLLAPDTPERHRALVRIEDVHPRTPPAQLRALVDVLAAEGAPFSVAVVPSYVDPRGGAPERVTLRDAPALVEALRYAVAHGGTLVMHGDTHQYGATPNPYTGVSVADYEFYRAHLDAGGAPVLDGPVPEDSAAWALRRADEGLAAFSAAHLPRPQIFEYPHYAGSAVDSRALKSRFPLAYQRGLYFAGALTGAGDDPTRSIGQFFPYPVDDVFGWRIVPENLGHYVPDARGGAAPRSAEDLIRAARANRVVRDGFASFFFHPMYPPETLRAIVRGIREAGFTFVAPSAM